jgi:hypothetical protein
MGETQPGEPEVRERERKRNVAVGEEMRENVIKFCFGLNLKIKP